MPESGETDHWPAGLSQDDELAITEFPGKSKDSGGSLSHTQLLSHNEIHHIQISLSFLCCRDLGQEPRPCRAVNRTLHAPYLTILTISQQPDKVKCRILKAYILIRTYIISQNAWGVDDLRGSEAVYPSHRRDLAPQVMTRHDTK